MSQGTEGAPARRVMGIYIDVSLGDGVPRFCVAREVAGKVAWESLTPGQDVPTLCALGGLTAEHIRALVASLHPAKKIA